MVAKSDMESPIRLAKIGNEKVRSKSFHSSFNKASYDSKNGSSSIDHYSTPSRRTRKLKSSKLSSFDLPLSPSPKASKKEKLKKMKEYLKHAPTSPAVSLARVQKKVQEGGSIKDLQQQILRLEMKIDSIEADRVDTVAKIKKIAGKERKKLVDGLAQQKEQNKLAKKASKELKKQKPIIDELKKHNALIREQNEKLAKNIKNLRVNNERLQDAALGNTDNVPALKEYYHRVKTDNGKLKKLHDDLKKKVKELKADYKERKNEAEMTHNIKCAYGNTIKSIHDTVQIQSGDDALKQHIAEIIEALELDKDDLAPTGMYESSPFLHFQKSAISLGLSSRSNIDFDLDSEDDKEDDDTAHVWGRT